MQAEISATFALAKTSATVHCWIAEYLCRPDGIRSLLCKNCLCLTKASSLFSKYLDCGIVSHSKLAWHLGSRSRVVFPHLSVEMAIRTNKRMNHLRQGFSRGGQATAKNREI